MENRMSKNILLAGTVLPISTKKQFFIDELLIEFMHGVRLTTNPPYATGELLVTADQPWEKPGQDFVWGGSSVVKDGEKVRLWYQVDCLEMRPQPVGFVLTDKYVAYAESEDGKHFKKPDLGLHEFRGTRSNNIVLPDVEGCSVWVDAKAPPEHRFRSQGGDEKFPDLVFRSSPDGFRWAKTHSIDIGNIDTQNIIFWDPTRGKYVLYTRRWIAQSNDSEESYRVHRRLESDDLVKWENEAIVLQADKEDLATYPTPNLCPPVDYYGACVFKYPDEQGISIMLAEAFWHWYPREGKSRPGPTAYDIRLLTSRDGRHFERSPDRAAFLRPGPQGTFYSAGIWVLPKPIQMGNEIWIYFHGANFDHDGIIDPVAKGQMRTGISRAVMRLDGFISADAEFGGGEIITPAVQFDGDQLELNVDTSAGGVVFVELLDEHGQPIKGYSRTEAKAICGNSVRMPVRWNEKQDVSELAGKTVKLHFIMRDCKIYAFQFTKKGVNQK
jgi:hypothetical protein